VTTDLSAPRSLREPSPARWALTHPGVHAAAFGLAGAVTVAVAAVAAGGEWPWNAAGLVLTTFAGLNPLLGLWSQRWARFALGSVLVFAGLLGLVGGAAAALCGEGAGEASMILLAPVMLFPVATAGAGVVRGAASLLGRARRP